MNRGRWFPRTPGAPPVRSSTVCALLLALVACAGCEKKETADQESDADEPAIEQEHERGPVALRLTVDKDQITIAQGIRLTLEARVREPYKAELPAFGEKLEQFRIKDYRTPAPELVDEGVVRLARTYELEPFLSGTYTIPPMTVTFRKPDEDKRHEIQTDKAEIEVTSLLPEDAAALAIRDIAPPVDLPRPAPTWWIAAAGGAAALLAALACGIWWRRNKRPAAAARARPAHDVAYDALEALVAAKLIEAGEIKEFHVRLSQILRRYIEDRFGLHAPERTTEEFLRERQTADALAAGHKELLSQFLRHCDQVKFAQFQPATEEIQHAFDACKRFIAETAPTEAGGETARAA